MISVGPSQGKDSRTTRSSKMEATLSNNTIMMVVFLKVDCLVAAVNSYRTERYDLQNVAAKHVPCMISLRPGAAH